jgi:hypothetical protein
MSLDFVHVYGGQRIQHYEPQPELWMGEPDAEEPELADVSYQIPADDWAPVTPTGGGATPWIGWAGCPRRFVDGKDVGETVAMLRAPGGYPIPVRLSQIGGTVVELCNGICRRRFDAVEHVISMVTQPFPWHEVESFGAALQQHGIRLLPAARPEKGSPYDFEVMRKAAQNRSNTEMATLEEHAVAQAPMVPTVVDGRLEPRSGGFDHRSSPVIGVVKTHSKNYLHPKGLQLLYQLQPGQRTPVFAIPGKFPVISWFLRFTGGMPNYGIVRVELAQRFFEDTLARDYGYIDRLSCVLYAYRCREQSYGRAPISLQPIVRAEQSLGALFQPLSILMSRFYRLAAI